MTSILYSDVRFDAAIRKHTHNSYQKHESLFDQALYNTVRSFELDIHLERDGRRLADPIDWWVFHKGAQKNETSCRTLRGGLARIAALRAVIPLHEVITIWIECKDSAFGNHDHTAADLDGLLKARLSEGTADRFLTPSMLASKGAWPTLEELRGKYVVVLLGEDADALQDYGATVGRLAFLQEETITGDGTTFDFDGKTASSVRRAPRINSAADWQSELRKGTQFIGTDMVDEHEDNYSFTHNALAWPFTIDGASNDALVEDADGNTSLAMLVSSGDLWGRKDSCYFRYVDVSTSTATEREISGYVAFQQGSSWAKGSFMARADASPDAPYLAICRPVCNEPAQLQFRRTRGGETERIQLANDDEVGQTNNQRAFARVTLSNGGMRVTGFSSLPSIEPDTASADGEAHTIDFGEPLRLLGIAGSSHGETSVAFTFGRVELRLDQEVRVLRAADLQAASIGSDVTLAAAHDGSRIGYVLLNVDRQQWQSEARALATLYGGSGERYLVSYRASDSQCSIDAVTATANATKLDNVYLTHWAGGARSLASLSLDGGQTVPFLANFRGDEGKISIDRLDVHDGKVKLTNVFRDEWAKEARPLAALRLGGRAFLANYRASTGQISLDELLTASGGALSLRNVLRDHWDAAERELAAVQLGDEALLVNYRFDTGQASIDRLEDDGAGGLKLRNVYRTTWLPGARSLTGLTFDDGSACVVNVRYETGRVSIDRVRASGSARTLENVFLDTWASGLRSLASWSARNAGETAMVANFRSGDVSLDWAVRYRPRPPSAR